MSLQKSSKTLILDLINDANQTNLTFEAINFTTPSLLEDGQRNTSLQVDAISQGGYTGSVTVQYNRIDLQSIANSESIPVSIPEDGSFEDLVTALNEQYSLSLALNDDIEEGDIDAVSFQPIEIELVASEDSFAFLGSTAVMVAWETTALDLVITSYTLNGLDLPTPPIEGTLTLLVVGPAHTSLGSSLPMFVHNDKLYSWGSTGSGIFSSNQTYDFNTGTFTPSEFTTPLTTYGQVYSKNTVVIGNTAYFFAENTNQIVYLNLTTGVSGDVSVIPGSATDPRPFSYNNRLFLLCNFGLTSVLNEIILNSSGIPVSSQLVLNNEIVGGIRASQGAVLVEHYLYMFTVHQNGSYNGKMFRVDMRNPVVHEELSATVPAPLATGSYISAAFADNKIFAIARALTGIYCFDLETFTWSTIGTHPSPNTYPGAMVENNGRIYLAYPNAFDVPARRNIYQIV